MPGRRWRIYVASRAYQTPFFTTGAANLAAWTFRSSATAVMAARCVLKSTPGSNASPRAIAWRVRQEWNPASWAQPEAFHLISDADHLATCVFWANVAKHHFCKSCGIHAGPLHAPRLNYLR